MWFVDFKKAKVNGVEGTAKADRGNSNLIEQIRKIIVDYGVYCI